MIPFFFRRNKQQPATEHPAYTLGEQLGRWLLRQEKRLADALNAWQSRVCVRLRNAVLLTILGAFATYFIWIFIQTF